MLKTYRNILIIGAGIAGKLLEKDIKDHHPDCKIIGFIDDKPSKKQKILGRIDDLSKINKVFRVDEMIIAVPSASGEFIRRILLKNKNNRIPIKIVPRSQRIISLNSVKYNDISNLELEDFLGRPFIKKNIKRLKSFYAGKKVFITGGAGSIGSEIVKQLIELGARVIVYDNSEYLCFNLDQSLKEKNVSPNRYQIIIGGIGNYEKINYLIKKEKPTLIIHAAAYKHVYLMQDNVDEAIHNNVFGTKNVVDIALKNKIKQFVFISTDKVVNPKSIMGATKKLSEYYIQQKNTPSTRTNIVRFGNVINSNGSVLPLFERQIREYKYVTVTHKNIQRFFMSIREAAHLVIKSTANNTRDNIHVLNMGDLINVYDVAQCLIRSKNLIPQKDVRLKIVGLKKGEKMIEELFTSTEKKNMVKTKTRDIFYLKNFEKPKFDLDQALVKLSQLASGHSNQKIKSYLRELFPSLKK